MQSEHFDILICGAGMAGASLALLLSELSEKPVRIALVEANPLDYGHHPGFDARAIALSAGSIDIYKQVGIWPELASYAQPIEKIHVCDRGHLGQVSIGRDEYGIEQLGAVIELAHAGRVLHQRLQQRDNITLFCPAKVGQISSSQTHQRVILTDGRTLEAKLVVGADGGASDVAVQMKLDAKTLDFGQSAIIANVQCNLPHQARAFERFTEFGPVALLPMLDNRWSLVWCVSHSQANRLSQCDDAQFLARLQTMFGYRVGRFEIVGKRDVYPLILTTRSALFSHRSVIIGNAAHSLHPIAGQGFNLGIRDAATLAQLLKDAEDPGAFALLNRYRQLRKEDITTTVGLTSALAIGFSSKDKLSVVARNIALVALAKCPELKAPLVRQTLGMLEIKNSECDFAQTV